MVSWMRAKIDARIFGSSSAIKPLNEITISGRKAATDFCARSGAYLRTNGTAHPVNKVPTRISENALQNEDSFEKATPSEEPMAATQSVAGGTSNKWPTIDAVNPIKKITALLMCSFIFIFLSV